MHRITATLDTIRNHIMVHPLLTEELLPSSPLLPVSLEVPSQEIPGFFHEDL